MLALIKTRMRNGDTGEMEWSLAGTVDTRVSCHKQLIAWQKRRAKMIGYSGPITVEMIENPQGPRTEGRTPQERAENNVAVCFGIGVERGSRSIYLRHVLRSERDPEVFWRTFNDVWASCDGTANEARAIVKMCRKHLKQRSLEWMDPEDRRCFESLPDPVRVWRGCSIAYVDEPSWTTDLAVAEFFAHRLDKDAVPVLASAFIPKSAIFATFTSRNEAEVFLDPAKLQTAKYKRWKGRSKAAEVRAKARAKVSAKAWAKWLKGN
jgi:hypothetical protein